MDQGRLKPGSIVGQGREVRCVDEEETGMEGWTLNGSRLHRMADRMERLGWCTDRRWFRPAGELSQRLE